MSPEEKTRKGNFFWWREVEKDWRVGMGVLGVFEKFKIDWLRYKEIGIQNSKSYMKMR